MTRPGGSRARWAAFAVVAPAGAALLAGATGWALQHAPAATPSAQQQQVAALQRAITAARLQANSLDAATARLRNQPPPPPVAAPSAPSVQAMTGASGTLP